MPANQDRPVGVTLLALLYLLIAVVFLGISAAMAKGVLVGSTAPQWVIGGLARRAPYLALLALLPAALAFGLWNLQNWARMITIGFSLVSFIGGGYTMVNIGVFALAAPRYASAALTSLLVRMAINAIVALYLMRPSVAKAFQEAW